MSLAPLHRSEHLANVLFNKGILKLAGQEAVLGLLEEVLREREIEPVLGNDELATAIPVRKSCAPGQIVDLAVELGAEIAVSGTVGFTTTAL